MPDILDLPFLETPGYKPPLDFVPIRPLEFFQLFFTDELLERIVSETNNYATRKMHLQMPFTQYSAWRYWKPVTLQEIKAFFGVILNMVLNPKPQIDDYFSNRWLDAQVFFKDVFSKQRFFMIYWNVQIGIVSNNKTNVTTSNSNKVRALMKELEINFQKYFVPDKYISIDGCTIGFKGRVSFRVYNKDNPPSGESKCMHWLMRAVVTSIL